MPRQIFTELIQVDNKLIENILDFRAYRVGTLWKNVVEGGKLTKFCTLTKCPVCGCTGRQNDALQIDHYYKKTDSGLYTATSCYDTVQGTYKSYYKALAEADMLRIAKYMGVVEDLDKYSEDAIKYAKGVGWI